MTGKTLRIATRRSQLALWQANATAQLLAKLNYQPELVTTETTGDRIQTSALSLAQMPVDHPARKHVSTGKGLFIKEVQDLLLSGACSLAVHSMKDLPVSRTPGLTLAGFLPAASAADVLILSPDSQAAWPSAIKEASRTCKNSAPFLALDTIANSLGKPIGTTSTRRHALLRACGTKTADITMLRGNVDTRLNRVAAGEFSAILLAEAGLQRLGLYDPENMVKLPLDTFVPACAQGVVGIECSDTEPELAHRLFTLTDPHTIQRVLFERLVLRALGGDCHSIIGIHASKNLTEFLIFTAAKTDAQEGGHWSSGQWNEKPWSQVLLSLQEILPGHGKGAARSFSEAFERLQENVLVTKVITQHLDSFGHLRDVT
jgi:hydroxymethylbilane synthase